LVLEITVKPETSVLELLGYGKNGSNMSWTIMLSEQLRKFGRDKSWNVSEDGLLQQNTSIVLNCPKCLAF
jgi:hypothetical protein